MTARAGPKWAYAQPNMFDVEAGEAALNEAVERVEEHASDDWLAAAASAVRLIAEHRSLFTTDPVWAILERRGIPGPHEQRALGAVMRRMQRLGVCEPTNQTALSARPICHRRPLRVW